MSERKKVEGYNDLYRNEKGAIINTDKQGYEAYVRRRAASRKKDSKVSSWRMSLLWQKMKFKN